VLYLVRHAKAGDRSAWRGDDMHRPLTPKGRRQAELLAERLAFTVDGELLSSPYLRCVETLEPLAVALGSRVRVDRRLTEGTGFVGALQVLGEAPDNSVLCSHGDVIPDTMQALQRRGCHIIDEPNWGKGSVWLIHRDAHGDFTEASVWPPPEV
jgi:8-oxo-dGTP diphosphatase